jgi:hypothetical protein
MESRLCNIKAVRRYIDYFHWTLTRREVQILHQKSARNDANPVLAVGISYCYPQSFHAHAFGRMTCLAHVKFNHCRESSRLGLWTTAIIICRGFVTASPVVKNMAIPIVRRMITRLPCWGWIRKFVLQIPQRCGNKEWATFLSQVSTGQLKTINT